MLNLAKRKIELDRLKVNERDTKIIINHFKMAIRDFDVNRQAAQKVVAEAQVALNLIISDAEKAPLEIPRLEKRLESIEKKRADLKDASPALRKIAALKAKIAELEKETEDGVS